MTMRNNRFLQDQLLSIDLGNITLNGEQIIRDIINKLYQLKSEDSQTDGCSNVNGWQKEINNKIEYLHIRKMIMNEFVNYFQKNIQKSNIKKGFSSMEIKLFKLSIFKSKILY